MDWVWAALIAGIGVVVLGGLYFRKKRQEKENKAKNDLYPLW